MKIILLISALICAFSNTFPCVLGQNAKGNFPNCLETDNVSVYVVTDFGAVPDDESIDTEPIQNAILQCAQNGGGRVVIPKGRFISGTLNLYSGVDFHLEKGAVLEASLNLSDYQRHNSQLAGLFYTEKVHDVSISGKGLIDGRGLEFMDTSVEKSIGEEEKQFTRQGSSFRKVSEGSVGDGPYNPKERYHQMIVFSECTGVSLSEFSCKDSPYWCFLIVHSDSIRIDGLTIDNNLMIPNSDGIDIISCSDVLIENCVISAGDDAIVTAGYGWHQGDPGFKNIARSSSNIEVRNCTLQSRSSAIRVGGNDLNSMSDYRFHDITIKESNRGINISVSDSAGIDGLLFEDIEMETRLHTGDWWGQGEPINITDMTLIPGHLKLGAIKNVTFRNISAVSENSALIIADPQAVIENIVFDNCDFTLRRSRLEETAGGNYDLRLNAYYPLRSVYSADTPILYLENVRNASIVNSRFRWEGNLMPWHTYSLDARNVSGLTLRNNVMASSREGMKAINIESGAATYPKLDKKANAVLSRLFNASRESKILYGHQDDLSYGHSWTMTEKDILLGNYSRSDVKSVSGDFPAVVGFDLGDIELGNGKNLDGVDFRTIREAALTHVRRGGIVTFSWHLRNPATGGDTWDTSSGKAVSSVLEGGVNHELFMKWLSRLADYLSSFRDNEGDLIPIIFRPWHENLASWFWWGKDLCTEEEYVSLYRMTWNYLVGERGFKNLLWAYSPNSDITEDAYMSRYPGDDIIDILGVDIYEYSDDATFTNSVTKSLSYLKTLGEDHGKVTALTETGYESIPEPAWWTKVLLPAVKDFPISYLLTWRNSSERPGHYYAPYPGSKDAEDFKMFHDDDQTVFLNEL